MSEERAKYGKNKRKRLEEEFADMVSEAAVQYGDTGIIETDNSAVLISMVRKGIPYHSFERVLFKLPFSMEDWSSFLHLSERTMQRYKKENKIFESLQAERILQISLLYQKGVEVFGDSKNFDIWLDTLNLALGSEKPKNLLDNIFGISLLEDELIRIEHGVLA